MDSFKLESEAACDQKAHTHSHGYMRGTVNTINRGREPSGAPEILYKRHSRHLCSVRLRMSQKATYTHCAWQALSYIYTHRVQQVEPRSRLSNFFSFSHEHEMQRRDLCHVMRCHASATWKMRDCPVQHSSAQAPQASGCASHPVHAMTCHPHQHSQKHTRLAHDRTLSISTPGSTSHHMRMHDPLKNLARAGAGGEGGRRVSPHAPRDAILFEPTVRRTRPRRPRA